MLLVHMKGKEISLISLLQVWIISCITNTQSLSETRTKASSKLRSFDSTDTVHTVDNEVVIYQVWYSTRHWHWGTNESRQFSQLLEKGNVSAVNLVNIYTELGQLKLWIILQFTYTNWNGTPLN